MVICMNIAQLSRVIEEIRQRLLNRADEFHEDFVENDHPRNENGQFAKKGSYSVNAKNRIHLGERAKKGESYSVNARHKKEKIPGEDDVQKRLREKRERKAAKIKARHKHPDW